MAEFSGRQWCARFPTSTSLDDLIDPFRTGAKEFIGAIEDAGAQKVISATWRPEERAYLMHWCCLIAGYRDKAGISHQIAPEDVPAMTGIYIDWTCGGDHGLAIANAVAMREGYGIVFPAALASMHTKRLAFDATFTWKGIIQVKDARGVVHGCATQQDLWPIGATYGVLKLASDPPHWSESGH